ncbi:MAG TPA: hypothetical protein VEY33_03730 [Gemmatimonadota bacterium]|nr:hypothetical protein [Gemmatimonadota bacterium]
MNYFSCTESDIGPAIDFVWSGLNIAGAVIAASDETIQDREQTIAIGAMWGLLSGTSGFVGMSRSEACRGAKAQLADRQARGQAGPEGVGLRATGQSWSRVRVWRGSGNFTTERFRVEKSDWRVTWVAMDPGYGAQMYVSIEDGSGQQVTRGAVQGGAGNGQVYVTSGPGDYYLEITAVNLSWEVAVDER